MILSLKNIRKKYKKSHNYVLDGINFDVEEGKLVVVTGASGSGKSTLLAVAGGYLKPNEGEVLFHNNNIYSLNDSNLSILHNRSIGYVPQSNLMIKGYTVIENIIIPYRFSDKSGRISDIWDRAFSIMKALDIEKLHDRYPYELSGGEQKRAALTRALLYEPELVIADEPTSGLDKKTAEMITEYLAEYVDRGKTVIAASHDEMVIGYGKQIISLPRIS